MIVPYFQIAVWGLQAIAAVVVIVVGIPNIVKNWNRLGPASRVGMVKRTASWAALVLNLGGLAVWFIWKDPLLPAALFAASFVATIVLFRLDPSPVDRDAVVKFGVTCCLFTILFTMVFMWWATGRILDEIGRILELFKILAH